MRISRVEPVLIPGNKPPKRKHKFFYVEITEDDGIVAKFMSARDKREVRIRVRLQYQKCKKIRIIKMREEDVRKFMAQTGLNRID